MPAVKRRGKAVKEQGALSELGEDIAETGVEALLDGLADAAMSAGEIVLDAAGNVAETAVDIVADVAGSALDGL
ncbi:MAG: hypothetical protein AB7F98_10130 [Novosphingobium sp.]